MDDVHNSRHVSRLGSNIVMPLRDMVCYIFSESSDESMSNKPPTIEHMAKELLEAAYHSDGRLRKHPKQSTLSQREILFLLAQARDKLQQEATLLEIEGPVNVVGDLHGQFLDMMRIFEALGHPPTQRYLFLGDYVDRGPNSIDTISLLLCFKVMFPDQVFLLRGNHETPEVCRIYGFYDECKRRYSIKLWRMFTHVFRYLPIAAVIGKRIFCAHGGLSPQLHRLEDLKSLVKPIDVFEGSMVEDVLWSDPEPDAIGWRASSRGVSYVYGMQVLEEFLQRNELDLVCRAHEVVEDGYEFFGDRRLLTIFSATNYCGQFDNCGGVLRVDSQLVCSLFILKPLFKTESMIEEV